MCLMLRTCSLPESHFRGPLGMTISRPNDPTSCARLEVVTYRERSTRQRARSPWQGTFVQEAPRVPARGCGRGCGDGRGPAGMRALALLPVLVWAWVNGFQPPSGHDLTKDQPPCSAKAAGRRGNSQAEGGQRVFSVHLSESPDRETVKPAAHERHLAWLA